MPRIPAILAAAVVSTALVSGTAQAGCLGGAVIGGVGGHFAGHHPILGAAAGCAVGHHLAVQKKRERMAARQGRYDRRG